MLKPEFINSLSYALGTMPQQERDKIISYYIELIDDKIESGKPEEGIISEFGDINALASTIIFENNATANAGATNQTKSIAQDQTQTKNKSGIPAWIIILLIIFSPAIFGLTIAAFSIIFALFIAAFAIIFAFFVTSAAFAISGVVLFFTSFIILVTEPAYAILQMGTGLFLAGLAIFSFMGTYYLTKGCVKLTGMTLRGIGQLFSKIRA